MHQADPAQTLSRVAGLPRSARAAGLDVVEAAGIAGYEWVTSPFLLDLVLRKPAPAR